MRIPKDIPLKVYIRRLIEEDRLEQFYLSEDWKDELRPEVLREYHYECQECLKKGTITKADCVHHVNEVRVRPDLALSKWFVDDKGQTRPNLVPLCNTCHNIVHDKLGKWQRKDKFINEERW